MTQPAQKGKRRKAKFREGEVVRWTSKEMPELEDRFLRIRKMYWSDYWKEWRYCAAEYMLGTIGESLLRKLTRKERGQ